MLSPSKHSNPVYFRCVQAGSFKLSTGLTEGIFVGVSRAMIHSWLLGLDSAVSAVCISMPVCKKYEVLEGLGFIFPPFSLMYLIYV